MTTSDVSCVVKERHFIIVLTVLTGIGELMTTRLFGLVCSWRGLAMAQHFSTLHEGVVVLATRFPILVTLWLGWHPLFCNLGLISVLIAIVWSRSWATIKGRIRPGALLNSFCLREVCKDDSDAPNNMQCREDHLGKCQAQKPMSLHFEGAFWAPDTVSPFLTSKKYKLQHCEQVIHEGQKNLYQQGKKEKPGLRLRKLCILVTSL